MITQSGIQQHQDATSWSGWKKWLLCCLIALPSILWPLGEWFLKPTESSIFLPFLHQIDVAYPLSWMVRISTDHSISDLSVWEYRHAPGSPTALLSLWPMLMGSFISFCGTVASYWMLVYLLHLLWLYITQSWINHWFKSQRISWFLASLFVYASFPIAINVFYQTWHFERWSPIFVYENFRAYPSLVALCTSTLSVWQLYIANKRYNVKNFALAGLCVSLTIYGRPFDWMILVTFIILIGLYSILKDLQQYVLGWLLCFIISVIGTTPFLVHYWLWTRIGTSIYEEGLVRGVMQGKEVVHFLKYGIMAVIFSSGIWVWLRWVSTKAVTNSYWTNKDTRFLSTLVMASFFPYFQYILSGKTISSYQYYFIYFTVPFGWFSFLIGLGLLIDNIRFKITGNFIWPLLGFLVGLLAQLCLLATPPSMISRMAFNQAQSTLYKCLAQYSPNAVTLSLEPTQDLIIRSASWSFVPYPMMYCYPSLAPTTELLERQLLAKLLLTGKVTDLAPLFSENGLPNYEQFYQNADAETAFWIDRLENCPARSFFVFHPIKSRKDLEIRHMHIPAKLLQQSQVFAYFEPPYQQTFHEVHSLEKLKIIDQVDWIRLRFRLTHILLASTKDHFQKRLETCSERLRLLAKCSDGSTLWSFKDQ